MLPLDLHVLGLSLAFILNVLGLSLAFILSQDQTLRCIYLLIICSFPVRTELSPSI